LVGLVVLLIGLVPLVQTFQGGFQATQMGREHTQALYLADSVLEEVRARVATSLSRYYRISDDARTIRDRASAGAWKAVFAGLSEGKKKVVGSDRSQISTYFASMVDGGGAPGPIGPDSDPITFAQYRNFTTEVKVGFDVEGAPIDSDGDSKGETDMCELVVTVRWIERKGEERSLVLSSIFTLEDFNRALGGS
jgi:hypothetical protein